MRKLLNTLSILTILGSTSASVVACKVNNDNGNEGSTEETLQKEMLEGAEFISRLVVGSRHENLNYNLNEILSIFLTPSTVALSMPQFYTYKNQNINMASNVNKFKNYLAPSLNYLNNDNGYAGMFASYIMGMYENDFYDNIINGGDGNAYYFNDVFSTSGDQGYNKNGTDNAMGYAAGLGSDINLSTNTNRRNLAWGIQDTGALSNYLLNLGFDGANPTDTNGTDSPKSSATNAVGTNGSGYAWYNSILSKGSATQSRDYPVSTNPVTNKMGDAEYESVNSENKSSINGIKFNSTGSLITSVAGEQNVNGIVSMFGSMLENISDTKNGALILGEFMNVLFPMINTSKSTAGNQTNIIQSVGISLTANLWRGIKNLQGNSLIENNLTLVDLAKGLDEAPSFPFTGSNIPKFSSLYKDAKRDRDVQSTNAKDVVLAIDELIKVYNSSSNKEEFNKLIFWDKESPFYKAYSNIMDYIGEDNWKSIMLGEDNDGGLRLLQFVRAVYSSLSDSSVVAQFEEIQETFKDEDTFRDLSAANKTKYLSMLGWIEGKGYIAGSLAAKVYNGFTDQTVMGQKEFISFFESFKTLVVNAMKTVHEEVLQYIHDEKYWTVNDFSINTTSNNQLGGKMEFTLDYSGVGDSTSTASKQTKQVIVGENFNPYQTIPSHQEKKWYEELKAKLSTEKIKESGKVLGLEQGIIKEDELISYDGLGNYQEYDSVQNSYKIVWENISDNLESPYWVITSIKCYNKDGQEFYNIY